MTSFVCFARRRNLDSSVDSVCTRCYRTVANAREESHLDLAEQSHACNSSDYSEDERLSFLRHLKASQFPRCF